MKVEVREALASDLQDLLQVHETAFGAEEGPEIRKLVDELQRDSSALPMCSLVATVDEQCVGHALFTKVSVLGASREVAAAILAPVAVAPELHAQGIGGRLIRSGLQLLTERGVELVFVLGHPSYYPRFGFEPAGVHGLEATHPIPEEHAAAWMVHELAKGALVGVHGKVSCSDVLSRPEYW